jgi:nitrate reductase gamma subunit
MDLLEFARGPALQWSVSIFITGVLWRLLGVFLLRQKKDLSEPRNPAAWKGLRLIALRTWPRREFRESTAFRAVLGYTFHVGFVIVLLFFAPHVLFFADLARGLVGTHLRGLTGFAWPTLPNGIITLLSAVALAALLAMLAHRIVNPVKQLISNFDDYFSWFVTAAPLVTGMAAFAHLAGWPYERLLAFHLLSVELLLVWFPFGKLMHAFTNFAARGATGLVFERRGASL